MKININLGYNISEWQIYDFKVYWYTSIFYRYFSKGDDFYDFWFASLGKENLQNWGLLLKERICS